MKDWLPPELVSALWDMAAWANMHPILFWGFIGALAINNGVRITYKEYATRPPWARFVVGVTDPLCGNVWRLASWAAAKLSLPFKFPSGQDDSQALPVLTARTVRDAVAVDEAVKAEAAKPPTDPTRP
jgi:hypothetical protein